MKKLRSLSESEQAVVQAMKDRKILEPLVKEMLPMEKLKRAGYGLCLCPDKDHIVRRVGFYTSFLEAERHPLTEHGGGVALAVRDEAHLKYKFQEFLFTAVRKGTQVFLVENHMACALVQDTWDINPWAACCRHNEAIGKMKAMFNQLVGNEDLLMEHYLQYTRHAVIKDDVKKALADFRPQEIEIIPVVDTYRISGEQVLDRTYKQSSAKILEYFREMDELVPQLLATAQVIHAPPPIVPSDSSFMS